MMNWKLTKSRFGSDAKILVITPYLRARVFWSSMTKRDDKKEYKAFIGEERVGEYPTEEEAMKEIELRINKIKNVLLGCDEK